MTENHNSVVNKFISDLVREKPQEFSYGQIMSFTSNFQFQIGFGAFGDVYKGVFPDGRKVAVKVLKNTTMDAMERQFMSEVGTMGRTCHENLIKLYGFCFDVTMKAVVYEYMENGSLESILYDPHIKWVDLYEIAIKIAKGLSYLHGSSPQIIHHDIKPANVLLDSKFCPKITDFGLAKLNKDLSHFTQTGYRGTPLYAAPEVSLSHRSITCKCDVYSFGIMLFDILRRKKYYSEDEEWFPPQVWVHLQNGQLDKIIMECGIGEEDKQDAEILSKVALLCAQFNAQDRPSMSIVATMLEGEIPPWTPKDNPFPYYVFSSDSRTRHARRVSTRVVSPADDERSDEAREVEFLKGAFLNMPIVHDQRNMSHIQKEGFGTNGSIAQFQNDGLSTSNGKDTHTDMGLQDSNGGAYMGTSGSKSQADNNSEPEPLQNRENGVKSKSSPVASNSNQDDAKWIEQYEPGVYINLVALHDGTRDLKRVRFSRRVFGEPQVGEHQAETWWSENREKVYEKYNVRRSDKSSSGASGQSALRTEEALSPSSRRWACVPIKQFKLFY